MSELTNYQEFIHKSRYARWMDDKKRRETWDETVDRYIQYFKNKFGEVFPAEEIRHYISSMQVMGSMRSLMTAGKALEKENLAGFNCSFVCVDHPRAIDEILYILLNGAGVGFSVERQHIAKLPVVSETLFPCETVISVHDSKLGWASSFKQLIALLYAGQIPTWDLSKVRPKGARLKTFGGRASGPEPLDNLFRFTVELFKKSAGRKLNSLECLDLICNVADTCVVGRVRRASLISLSNLSDDRMRHAKNGQWWIENSQRKLSNNSTCYTEKPEIEVFIREWLTLIESKSGERGIFNLVGAQKKASENGLRDGSQVAGVNPCGEILLRNSGLCNLSEIVVRENDTLDSLKAKARIAAIIGTFQSTLTNFRYIRSVWKKNAEEERLLGVSLTGIMDHPVLNNVSDQARDWLREIKQVVVETNVEWAEKLGINRSVALTCTKPSRTVSELVDSSSGIHPRYSDFYIRTVRSDVKDPLARLMKDQGVPVEPDVTDKDNILVFSFPKKSPSGSVKRNDMTAIEQLEHYKMIRDHWCDHNPSFTCYVRENEWLEVGAWVYKNWDSIGGVSFLPHSDHIYKQAPFQEIGEEEYLKMVENQVKIDFGKLSEYEDDDFTVASQELACSSGVCSII